LKSRSIVIGGAALTLWRCSVHSSPIIIAGLRMEIPESLANRRTGDNDATQ
jgi:hypothetical protein